MLLLAFILAAGLAALYLLRRRRRPPPLTVYLEGTIGAGKSTLAAALAATGRYHVIAEPVREWQDLEGHNLLGLLGQDRLRWAFPFQTLALSTLGDRDRQPFPPGKTRVLERSMACSLYVFAQDMLDNHIISEEHLAVLRRLRAALQPPSQRVHYLYVRTPPAAAFERMRRRGRDEESMLPMDYFTRLHRLLDHWLLEDERDHVTVIDGMLPPTTIVTEAMRTLDALASRGH